MTGRLTLLGLLTLLGSSGQVCSGTIAGVVTFTGEVPPAKAIMVTDGSILRHSDLVVDPATRGLRDVMVVLEGVPAAAFRKAEPVVVDQRDSVFVPRVVAVQQGQAVSFENSDLYNHSVMSTSINKDNQFNVFVGQGRPFQHVYSAQKTAVQIGCSLHPWMRAWIYVVPHPWFAVTDEKGRFKIDRVPAGKYTLWLRHADTGRQERRPIQVDGAETRFSLEWK